jgi:magnesium transporter
VGIITHDDAVDILEAESTEDIEMIAAVQASQSEVGYLETSVLRHFRRRIGWVIGLAVLGLVSGYIIYSFEGVLSAYFILAIYMPVIVAAGGNTGGQAATLVIRAMSLNEFDPRAFLRVLWKEIRIGLLIGAVLAVLGGIKIQFFSTSNELEGVPNILAIVLVVSLSFVLQVITSTTIGAVLPMTARALRLDPAVVASPAITTFVDVSGLLIYFTLAKMILGI